MLHENLGHCKYFVKRKKRYCKMLMKPGSEFCGEHQEISNISELKHNAESSSRILCPLDGKHTVYAHNLNKHLKKCNAREGDRKPYIQKSINWGNQDDPELAATESHRILSSFPRCQILHLIDKINSIYEKYVTLSERVLSCAVVEEEIQKPEYGEKTKKHLNQISAIIGLLDEYMMLKENTCFIEFGAGRGHLSYWIAKATEAFANSKILLVERASPKHKRDNKVSWTSNRIQRIRADIADLVLDKLDDIKGVENIVGVTKHLCGEATDLAIRCLTNTDVYKDKIAGTVLTFCCHHRCRWIPYTGKKFFEDNNLNVEDFTIMCGLSSWATCGANCAKRFKEKNNFQEKDKTIEAEKIEYFGFHAAQREDIGRKCKNIINWGRLKYFQEYNFQCLLHHYVGSEVTLENVCIVARKQRM